MFDLEKIGDSNSHTTFLSRAAQIVLGLIIFIPHTPMVLNIVALFDRFENLIKGFKNKNVDSPSKHRTDAFFPKCGSIFSARDSIFIILSTSRPIGLANPEVPVKVRTLDFLYMA